MPKRTIRVGSRDSRLAVEQTMLLLREIEKAHPELSIELITMKTTGDVILDRRLDQIGGKGLFVKELDAALADGRIDLSIHSLKDLPMEETPDYPLVAYSRRGDPRDVLVFPENGSGSVEKVGTSSLRRILQLQKLFPDAKHEMVRGNVLTRLKKLDHGEYTSLILAASGLNRLGLGQRISRYFSPAEMIPAAGQGVLAVQGRRGEDYSFLDCVHSPVSKLTSLAERSFVRALDGGCSSPVAAYAEVHGEELALTGLYYHEEGGAVTTGALTGVVSQAEQLGEKLANKLRQEAL
ncbi:Porphobilinogen deaminase [uncultured Ruminococcus sp.]|nr:Porphobilinogen deaminase [uncultured Ruminococcus sp.]SCH79386.1 Porphobilinogen deaminase [uncultured Clostridium sp.]